MRRKRRSRKKKRSRRWDSDSDSESSKSSEETVEDGRLTGRMIEEKMKREIIPEMRRQLVPSWRENNRAHGDAEQGHTAGEDNRMDG